MTSLTERPAHRPGRTSPGIRLLRRLQPAIGWDHASDEEIVAFRTATNARRSSRAAGLVLAFLANRLSGEGAAA
jgi:hypothetical protein